MRPIVFNSKRNYRPGSASRRCTAHSTVLRDTPSSPACVRDGGSRVPAGQRPCSMALRNCAYTCWRKVADEGAAPGAGLALATGKNWLLVDV